MAGIGVSRRDGPAVGVAVLLLVVSLLPFPETGGATAPPLGLPLDVWAHLLGYAALAVLVARGRAVETALGIVAVVLVTVAYGGAIELLQGLVASRTTSVVDGLVNGVGAAVGVTVWRYFGR